MTRIKPQLLFFLTSCEMRGCFELLLAAYLLSLFHNGHYNKSEQVDVLLLLCPTHQLSRYCQYVHVLV